MLAPVVMLVMTGMFGGIGVVVTLTNTTSLGLGWVLAPLLVAVPLYLRLERSMRRRFNPPGTLPTATIRS